eukprot:7021812-Pyramimonas_sp.AAC.1
MLGNGKKAFCSLACVKSAPVATSKFLPIFVRYLAKITDIRARPPTISHTSNSASAYLDRKIPAASKAIKHPGKWCGSRLIMRDFLQSSKPTN